MVKFGYALSSEEHGPNDLVAFARRAEETGFDFLMISDHFHPWTDTQGHSPFVWSVLGAIARETERIPIGTGVTCPTIRVHPAIVAQAAATAGSMMEGRFFLGVGTGENLNEHILGDRWPDWDVRSRMLTEAAQVIVCWGRDEAEARKTALDLWPTAAIPGESGQELPNPAHFEQLAKIVTEDMVAEQVLCGPDVDAIAKKVDAYVDAGFDHVYIHQIGPEQE